jgi:hypothetical protein
MTEKTAIIQCFTPPLTAGVYEVNVTQNVATSAFEEQSMSAGLKFGVDAARFTLNDADVYSVYPPANQVGNYTGSLPHIVFNRRTLPWERTIDGLPPQYITEKSTAMNKPPVPWMVVLLFTEQEMAAIKVDRNTIGYLLKPGAQDTAHPAIDTEDTADTQKLRLMPWESTNDGCLTADIPAELFQKYCPSLTDLTYMAHARETDIEHKDKAGIADVDQGKALFSVLVGNRIISQGVQYTALVVSVEGLTKYLPDNNNKTAFGGAGKIRVAVLARWAFNNSGDASFNQLVKGLELKSFKVNRGMQDAGAAKVLGPYYNAGYIPIKHLTRTGVTTVSWYHGPFVPLRMTGATVPWSFSAADAALRYDETTGFFDVSYAAAWQLGRVLALRDQAFSKAILNLRIEEKIEVSRKETQESLAKLLKNTEGATVKEQVLSYLGSKQKTTLKGPAATAAVPHEISDFLSKLYRLNGIPFAYLVPHELLLEKTHRDVTGKDCSGTLACFCIDNTWMEALFDGALSIGRTSNNEYLLEAAKNGGSIRPELTKLDKTGFILRSDLISGWRGIEIQAFGDGNTPLTALRFERVDSDIFLGIFDGIVRSIIITQPYEGLHFGLKRETGKYTKQLKDEKAASNDQTVNLDAELDILITGDVLSVTKTAGIMKQKLEGSNWMPKGGNFTSAEFAFQMVDSSTKRTIKINLTETA